MSADETCPLCGPFPEGCHGAFDRHEIDLLPHLTPAEQAAAVLAAKGIEQARRRLAPSDYAEDIEDARRRQHEIRASG